MKRIEIVVKPFELDEIKDAMLAIGVQEIIVTDVWNHGPSEQKGIEYRGVRYAMKSVPRTKIEIAVDDYLVDRIVKAVLTAAAPHSGNDDRILVSPIGEAIRIETGEIGIRALR